MKVSGSVLVDELLARGVIQSDRVRRAFTTWDRSLFLTDASHDAYLDKAIVTKRVGDVPVSSSSQPSLMAMMLELLDVPEGARVLEIGTGTGYNAALLSSLVGPNGCVVSLEIDTDVAASADRALRRAGAKNVSVLRCDGALGAPQFAPFDRLVVTAATADLPPAWWEQVSLGGRALIPITLSGAKKLVGFQVDGPMHWVSYHVSDCSFISMQGAAIDDEWHIAGGTGGDIRLTVRNRELVTKRSLSLLTKPRGRTGLPGRTTLKAVRESFMSYLALTERTRFVKLNIDEPALSSVSMPTLIVDPIQGYGFTFGIGDTGGLALLTAFDADTNGYVSTFIQAFGDDAAPVQLLSRAYADWLESGTGAPTSIEAWRGAVTPDRGLVCCLPSSTLSVSFDDTKSVACADSTTSERVGRDTVS